jgi:ABC-2 type transport system permease protein
MKKYIRSARQTLEIATEEWGKIFRDSGVVLVFFGACLIYPVLYGFIYRNEVYRNIPVAVVNQSRSQVSRDLIREMDGTPELAVRYRAKDMAEAKQLYAEGKVFGVVLIPQSIGADLAAGRQTQVMGYCSMASMMYYKGFYAGFNYACLKVNSAIRMANLTATGLTERQAETASEPVLSQGHSLYNPTGGFPSFLMPAVLVMILQQTLVLGIGMLAGTAREENRHHDLIPRRVMYHKPQRVIWGKAMAYFVLYLFLATYDLVLMPHVFQLPHLLSIGTYVAFVVPYLLASIFFGMAASVFFWNRETPLLLFLCTSVPLLFISGFSWPGTHIGGFWKTLSWFFPSTFGINAFLQMNSAGASITQVDTHLFALWVQAGAYFLLTYVAYVLQIRAAERRRSTHFFDKN